MRTAFFVLLFANVLFMAWASWVDVEPVPRVSTTRNLPPLKLADDAPPAEPAPEAAPESDDGSEFNVGPVQTAARSNCISVGPFTDLARAARAAALLRERGFTPEQRAEEGEVWAGYWVYIGDIQSDAQQQIILRELERARISDAHAMPASAEGRRVSVGLFTERSRAERRARAIQRLGFEPQIRERRQTGTVYWVDLDLQANNRTVPTEGLLSLEGPGSRLEIRVCPRLQAPLDAVPAIDGPPPTTTASADAPRPG